MNIDYESVIQKYSDSIDNEEDLKRLMVLLDSNNLHDLFEREGVSSYLLGKKAEEISDGLVSEAESRIETDENGYFCGDALEIESYIDDARDIDDYFHLGLESTLRKISRKIENIIPDEMPDYYEGGGDRGISRNDENSIIDGIFKAG